ncbi:hypothetical protein RJ639_047755 [Escallonia herrerae]|uniref:non-specific serine/threonine protein kinase n=1 Tax=Escallonia herrerae TaxID=1293975 RepID=A0AA88W6F1_9ASTE|nr:hypothetical protein RJ639_047755 [Escallonia herrerae]
MRELKSTMHKSDLQCSLTCISQLFSYSENDSSILAFPKKDSSLGRPEKDSPLLAYSKKDSSLLFAYSKKDSPLLPINTIEDTLLILGESSDLLSPSNVGQHVLYTKGQVATFREHISTLKTLDLLNLSHNTLSGSIPSVLSEMLGLTSIHMSDSQLEGPVPDIKAFQGAFSQALKHNKGLCGNFTGLDACRITSQRKKRKNVLILILLPPFGIGFLSILVLAIFLYVHRRVKKDAETPAEVKSYNNVFEIWSYDGKMVYENIIEDTKDFNSKHIVGVGGYGSVYRAELPSGQVVAVKKLHASDDGELGHPKGFTWEIRVLTEIRHRNIVKLYGFCSDPRHSFWFMSSSKGGAWKLYSEMRNKQ